MLSTQTVLTYKTYDEFVASRFKPGSDIVASLTPEKAELLHAAILLSGEMAELLDAVKKHVIYNKPLDITNVQEELGDIEFGRAAFYLSLDKLGYNLSPSMCAFMNQAKLEKRYPQGYSDKDAQERKDKHEPRA